MENFDKNKIPRRARILLIKLRSIGDVVGNTAVYGPLKRSFPDSHLTVVVEPPSYDLVRDHPDVDEVLCFDKKSFLRQIGFYAGLFRGGYDVAIDMHEGPRGAVMCFLSGAPLRVGHKFAKRSFLYNVKLSFEDLKPCYPIDYQVALIKKMGVTFDKVAPAIYLGEASRNQGARLLVENGVYPEEPFCILHPGARKYDQWKPERFGALADYIHTNYGFKVIVACGPGQEDLAYGIKSYMERSPFRFVQTGLQELAAITEKARFVVCHNGGYMHLAAAMKTPVIALFGWANPKVWKPMGKKNIIIYKNLECSPCNSKTIRQECLDGDPECKRLITVEDIVDGIERVLKEVPPSSQ